MTHNHILTLSPQQTRGQGRRNRTWMAAFLMLKGRNTSQQLNSWSYSNLELEPTLRLQKMIMGSSYLLAAR